MAVQVSDQKRGVVTLFADSIVPADAAKEAENAMQVMDARWKPRWGNRNYGAALPGSVNIDGAVEYTKTDGTTELITIGGGKAYRSTSGGSQTEISGATFTAGLPVYFLQIKDLLYVANGTDPLARYNGTSFSTYTQISAPTGGGSALTTLTSGSYHYYYQVVALNDVGMTPGSTELDVAVNKRRDTWSGGEKVTISWSTVSGATRYQIYMSDTAGHETYLASVTGLSYEDTGADSNNTFMEVPIDNTTGGPKFKQMELSGNRIWATGDPGNPHRLYWGGTGVNQGYFSPFYGGGYVDIEKGGAQRMHAVVHFRDGKGDPFVTGMTSDAEGNGSMHQIALATATVGTTSILVPTVSKVVGSIGTEAPRSIVKAGNSIYFWNKKGAFALGSKPSVLNVLTTEELSVNIRPSVQAMRQAYAYKAAGYHFQGKILYSICTEGTENNQTWVYDLERNKNWAGPWTVGFKQFLEYTDNTGQVRLLGVPSSGSYLHEISEDLQSNNGSPIPVTVSTGKLPVNPRDRLGWGRVKEVEIELEQVSGELDFVILGEEKRRGFRQLGSKHITTSDSATNQAVGWGTYAWSMKPWSDTSIAPTGTAASSSIIKRIRVNKLVRNLQFKVTSNSNSTSYVLIAFYAYGAYKRTSAPRAWKT